MPKEKTKTQGRKKQGTDVSDALFHVTPQPTIDIFEALGGAINVQTAAFLTGKIDSLDPQLPEPLTPVHTEERSEIAHNSQENDLPDSKKSAVEDSDIPSERTSAMTLQHTAETPQSHLQHGAQDVGQSDPKSTQSMGFSEFAPNVEVETDTTSSTPDLESGPRSGPVVVPVTAPTSLPLQNINSQISHKIAPEDAQDAEYIANPNQATIQSSEMPSDTSEQDTKVQGIQRNPAMMDTVHQENPIIADIHDHNYANTTDNYRATRHAIFYANDHSTANSTAPNAQKNSMPDSAHASNLANGVNSTAISPQTHPQDISQTIPPTSTAPSIVNNTPQNVTQAPSTINANSMANSPQFTMQNSAINPQASCNQYNTAPHSHPSQMMAMQPTNLLQQLTKREEELLQFLRQHHGQIVSYSQMLKALNWRESQRCTARNIIARFEANGIIQRQRIQGTRSQGYLFTMCDIGGMHTHTPMSYSPYQAPTTHSMPTNMVQHNAQNTGIYNVANSTQNSMASFAPNTANYQVANSIAYSTKTITGNSTHHIAQAQPHTSTPSYIDKIDRLIQSIWQSDQETIAACWPAVASAGLRSAHLRQLQSIFELQGFEPGTVSLGLRYLDWQLEQGPLTNARGEVIEDPIAYWLSSMRRHGYYSRPKGYVDPLLEAKRLLAEEEQSKVDMQARLDEARQASESAAEDQRCEFLFNELMQQGTLHQLWLPFYQRLPLMFQHKVNTEGHQSLAKKFGMVRALLKELV